LDIWRNIAAAKFNTGGTGTQTAGLCFGGYAPTAPGLINVTEEYNGTSWATVNPMNTARYLLAGAGIQTATL
jgi:hypothetical protein